ncbi:MAG TPA: VWA domain-containing protein, partial [Thermoanaerobaculia bacterium]
LAALKPVRTRRTAPDPHGDEIDLARTARESRKTLGDLAPLRYRRRVLLPPPLVVLCDVSGSMGRYSEMLLHFLHAMLAARGRAHAFLFATRLTDVTRTLRRRDPDEALARCGRQVADWSGGTRLRACLHDFNRRYSRRVLGHGAVVLLVTDGLDRDSDPGLAAEADRLHRSCRRLVWLNPLLRWEGFSPRAQGVRALLPHVDEHRPVHNLASLEALAAALAAPVPRRLPARVRRTG